ncbi:uncharacterized protein [Lolium perenne]|uniref:uncharacterized protein n=1 Tax=Lolium perenne TaxID=4522 RepID=UPI0021EA5552|nr:UBP1-associated protein 2B-like [Lolium perenne]XP_051227387.1 UBP1-associated protein 2B-like [Lolium perenne]
MARKKRKVDPAQSAATSHQQEHPSSELNSCGTTYIPITDDPPPPPAEAAAAAADEESDGSDGDDEEDVTKLLELLSREQLVELLRRAAEKSPWTMADVRCAAEADPASRKLFVHGLAWRVGAQDLRSAFSRFGDLEDCNVILDKQSRKSKGYGFVLFRSRAAALRALRCPQLQIAGRLAICQFAASGPTTPSPKSQNPSSNAPASSSPSQPDNIQRKIFVGNVHANVDVARLYEYFSQFGEIEEGPFGFDKSTGKPKGFALFVYKSEESARRALEEPMKNFDGKVLNVQKATDGRTKSTPAGSNSNANSSATAASAQMTAPSVATPASAQMTAPFIAAVNPYDPLTYGVTAASAQMTAPSIAAINPYDPSTYRATAVHDMAVAQQAAMLGMGAQQQAFVQPNASSGTPNNAPASSSSSQPDYMQRKVFVGNVHADVDVDRLYEYFSQFGEIEEGPLGFDKWTGKPKGFALFFYKSEESARRALEEPMKNFDGKVLNVQKAKDWRTKSAPAGSNSNANSNATAASSQMAAPSIAAINPYDPSTYGATAASAQMTAPSIAAINPYDPSTYGATAVQDMAVAQQAAMLGMSAQQQAFVQPNTAMLAMMAAAMQNPTMFAALNPSFAAMDAGGQHTGIPDFGGQGFGPQGFATGGVNFPPAAGGLQGAAAYQGCLPGFQGTPGFPTSAGFQVGQAASQKDTTAAAGATGYQAGPAGQGQMLSSNTDFLGGY